MFTLPDYFRDANDQPVAYDGSPVHWRVSVYGILIQDHQLLVAKQAQEKFWDFPGGGIELTETIEEALIREGLEETGWLLEPVRQVNQIINFFYHTDERAFYKTLQLYWIVNGTDSGQPPTDRRITQVRLQPVDQLDDIELFANARTALSSVTSL